MKGKIDSLMCYFSLHNINLTLNCTNAHLVTLLPSMSPLTLSKNILLANFMTDNQISAKS